MTRSCLVLLALCFSVVPFASSQDLKNSSIPDLIQALDRGEKKATLLLKKAGPGVVELLGKEFATKAPSQRLARARFLAAFYKAKDTPLLADILEKEKDLLVTLTLIHALGRRDLPGWRDYTKTRVKALRGVLERGQTLEAKAALKMLANMDEKASAQALAKEIKAKGSRYRVDALKGLTSMENGWPFLPALYSTVERELPQCLDLYLAALGRRFSQAALAPLLDCIGKRNLFLKSAAMRAMNDMDVWLLGRKDHSQRFFIYKSISTAYPGDIASAMKAAAVVIFDNRKLADSKKLLCAIKRLLPSRSEAPMAQALWARFHLLEGIDLFLAGKGKKAVENLRKAMKSAEAEKAKRQIPSRDDALLKIEHWLAWRNSFKPPLDSEKRNLYIRTTESDGGLEAKRHISILRLLGEIACVGAVASHLSGMETKSWLSTIAMVIDELESAVDAGLSGVFREHGAMLSSEWGAVTLLQRGLGRAGNWEAGEKGFRFLIDALHRIRPDLFLPVNKQSRGWTPSLGDKEKAFSLLPLELVTLLEEAGEQEKALKICLNVERKLKGMGTSDNLRFRMLILSRLGGIYSDMRQPDKLKKVLNEYMNHYRSRKAEIEQHPEFFNDPKAALRWVNSILSSGHISLSVCANVLLQDEKAAGYHCRRAFELESSDFTRILYACYLARKGDTEKARRLAEAVDVSPQLYYNLACTWALMGEKERALDLLEMDFRENHYTPKARNIHREWMRKDRDLTGLADEPRFKKLLEME